MHSGAPGEKGMMLCVLHERPVDFAYGYRMRCGSCGGATLISASRYLDAIRRDAHVDCEHCYQSVWIGPATALLRNDRDVALDNATVPKLAWYHTSTWPDWPSPDHRATIEEQFRGPVAAAVLGDVDAAIERAATRAVHIGTYEAAIENMLRRMRDQADGTSQFFLYRVRLSLEPQRIEPGYRDENSEDASQLAVSQLDDVGVDAVRYLNVHEALGSLSLAVRPDVIGTVQQLAIPVGALVDVPPAGVSDQLVGWEAERQKIVADTDALPTGTRVGEAALMRLGVRPDPDGVGTLLNFIDDRRWSLWDAVERTLCGYYLRGVSPLVANDLLRSIAGWRETGACTVSSYAERLGGLAALLTRPAEVIALVAGRRGVEG